MEIDRISFFNIFKNNFSFKIMDTDIGKAVKMDSYNAFLYSIVTGSVYFDNIHYPYTPKGLTKIFNDCKDYKIISGLFDEHLIVNSPYLLSKQKSFLFSGDKYIIPIEFQDEDEYFKQLKELKYLIEKSKMCTTDFIFQRIEKYKKGNGMEPFMEYVASMKFKEDGYIVENQTPLTYNLGSPDFIAWQSPSLVQKKGLFIVELMMLRIYPQKIKEIYEKMNTNINSITVGEVKTSTTNMNKQVAKYLSSEIFDFAFEIHPYKKEAGFNNGLLTFNSGEMYIKQINPDSAQNTNIINKMAYLSWLENYFKIHILANFTNFEINLLSKKYLNKQVYSQEDIISLVKIVNKDDLFFMLESNLLKEEG